MKRIRAMVLALLLLVPLTGIHYGALAEAGVSYTEDILALPDGYTAAGALTGTPDGGFAVAAKGTGGGWALLTWASLNAAPDVLPLTYEGGDIAHIDIAPDGRVAAVLSNIPSLSEGERRMAGGEGAMGQGEGPALGGEGMMSEDSGPQVSQRGAEGSEGPTFFSIGGMAGVAIWFDAQGNEARRFEVSGVIAGIEALDGGMLAVFDQTSGVAVYDENGKTTVQVPDREVSGFTARGGELIVTQEGKITIYDAGTGQRTQTMDAALGTSVRAATAADGSIYLMNADGLYLVDFEVGNVTRLSSGIGTLYGDPGNAISGFAAMADGSVVALIAEGEGNYASGRGVSVRIGGESQRTLAVYRRDASGASAKTPFTITSLYASSKLRKAASDFQRLHPELAVSLETRMEQGDESPVDDHIRTLNTDLMAGKGGDVMILDGLPADRYAAKGMLADLTDLAEGTGLLGGILSGSRAADGKVYGVPTQFTFDTIWGEQAIIDAVTSLEDLPNLPLADGQDVFYTRTAEEWLRLLVPASSPGFVDENGTMRFDTPAFEAFLETVYSLYTGQSDLPTGEAERFVGDISGAELSAMLNGSAALYPATVGGLMQLNVAYTASGDEAGKVATLPAMDGAGRTYTPSLIAGVNAQSQNREAAEEFVRLLLSDELQQLEQTDGLPVVAASLDALIEDAIERKRDGMTRMMLALEGNNPMEIKQLDEAALNRLREICDTLDVSVVDDETLMGFILEETEAFFNGAANASDAAWAVQQRAWAYLNE